MSEFEAVEIISRAVDRIGKKGRYATLELTNGIVLRLKSIPPFLIQAVNQEFKTPSPPKVFIEEKGREEENPNDPNYLKLLDDLASEQQLAYNNLILGTGTEVDSIPEDYFPPESDEWIEQVEFAANLVGKKLHIEKEDRIKRYICWLKFYALETTNDSFLCNNLPLMLWGVREGEIDEVVEYFQRLPERRAHSEGETPSGSSNGHTDNRATRRASARI